MLRPTDSLPPSGRKRSARRQLRPEEINPYVAWVHEHPTVLLPAPTPADLRTRLTAAGPGPLVVDLGCGSGNFLLAHAQRDPALRCVGFELRYKRLVKAARKAERAGLENLWFLRAPAEGLADYFAPGSLAAVHVNFPDPWPRPSDWRKRLVSVALLQQVSGLLAPGGRFYLRTDHSGYFLHALQLLPEVCPAAGLRLAAFSNDLHRGPSAPDAVRTEFENLFRAQGKAVYGLTLERTPPRSPRPASGI